MRRLLLLLVVILIGCGGREEAPGQPSPGKLRAERAVRGLQSGPATHMLCADLAQFGSLTTVPPEARRKCDDLLVAEREEKKRRAAAAVAGLKTTYDEVARITTYTDPSASDRAPRSRFSLYFTETKDGLQPLRMRFVYYGDQLIDPPSATLFADGRTYQFWLRFNNARYRETHRNLPDPPGPPYYDEGEEAVNRQDEMQILRAMASAKKAIVRLDGIEGDHRLTPEEQRALTNVIEAWEAKGGKL